MGRKTKDVKPTCKGIGKHNYEYIADEYSYTLEGHWELYKCVRCGKAVTVEVPD